MSTTIGTVIYYSNAIKFAAEASAKTASGVFFISNVAFQAVASPVSSYASSGWEVYPEFRHIKGQNEIQESENESDQYNEEGLVYPEEGLDQEPDIAEFKHFLSGFREEIAMIVGGEEAEEWLE